MRTTFLKWMIVVGGACLATAVIHPRLARSADHLDSPATVLEPAADINDVYAFLPAAELAGGAATHVVFAMTVYPAAPADAKFSDTVQYVLHAQSGAGFPTTTSDYNIICQFDTGTPQKASCWGGTDEYVTGDASTALTSADGKFKVFAGRRADPFFFNLDGFKTTVAAVDQAAPFLMFNDAGCPAVDGNTSNTLVTALSHSPDGGPAVDFFKNLSGLAIVVEIDKTLVTKGGPAISVWGSTHKKS